MYSVFYGHGSLYSSTTWSYGNSSAPPRVEVASGLVRQDNFAPSRRFRGDGLKALKLSPGGGRQSEDNSLGVPAVAKQTKLMSNDSLEIQVEPVVCTWDTPENEIIQILEAMWHAQCFT